VPCPVLLAEDDATLRDLFSRALAKAGYSLFVAENGTKALDIVAGLDGAPFVLLTDVFLTGLNGYELAKEVVRRTASAKVGFIAGWFDEKRVALNTCSDCWCILQKPFMVSDLVRFVARIASQELCKGLSDQPSTELVHLGQARGSWY